MRSHKNSDFRSTRGKKPGNSKEKRPEVPVEEKSEADTEGLSLLIPDIQETAELLERVLNAYQSEQAESKRLSEGSEESSFVGQAVALSNEERYMSLMKPLQFGEWHF